MLKILWAEIYSSIKKGKLPVLNKMHFLKSAGILFYLLPRKKKKQS